MCKVGVSPERKARKDDKACKYRVGIEPIGSDVTEGEGRKGTVSRSLLQIQSEKASRRELEKVSRCRLAVRSHFSRNDTRLWRSAGKGTLAFHRTERRHLRGSFTMCAWTSRAPPITSGMTEVDHSEEQGGGKTESHDC